MDSKLTSDLNWFFQIYQVDVDDILRRKLPHDRCRTLNNDLEGVFMLFQRSLLHRLDEEFRNEPACSFRPDDYE